MAAAFQPHRAARPPPVAHRRRRAPGCARNLFGDWQSALATCSLVGLLAWLAAAASTGRVLNAVLAPERRRLPGGARQRRVLGRDRREVPAHPLRPLSLRRAVAAGASRRCCWSALLVASCIRRFWKPWLGAAVARRAGGLLRADARRRVRPRRRCATDRWGGLPLTIMLATLSIVARLSARRAGGARPAPPACRRSAPLCVVYVELIRGVPLISVLFMASFMFPLFMPPGMTIDVLMRVLVGHHAVRRRLPGRDRARRPAGDARGPGRGGRRRSACATGRRSARSSCRRRWRWSCRAS